MNHSGHDIRTDSLFNFWGHSRCGNVAAILELDENLNKEFRVFQAAPQVCIPDQLMYFGKWYLPLFISVSEPGTLVGH